MLLILDQSSPLGCTKARRMEGFEDASSAEWGQGRERGSLLKEKSSMKLVGTRADRQLMKKSMNRGYDNVTG